MKKIVLIAAITFIANTTTQAQIVNIPDANFKAYLVGNTAINTNLDTEIQVSEAVAYNGGINCMSLSIADLTGVEQFTALTQLDCNDNLLTSLNVSSNTALTNLNCGYNQLTVLNVSSNTALTYLRCYNNQLATLNVSTNTALTFLNCYYNQITTLNLTTNTVLTVIDCRSNLLTTLNVKNTNNTNFISFTTTNNPSLTCIEVDNAVYSNTNWIGTSFQFDGTSSFSENCSGTISVNEIINANSAIAIYPNPTKNHIKFSVQTNVQLTNMAGQIIADIKNVNMLDLSDQPTGIYFLTITNNNGHVVQRSKIVKD